MDLQMLLHVYEGIATLNLPDVVVFIAELSTLIIG